MTGLPPAQTRQEGPHFAKGAEKGPLRWLWGCDEDQAGGHLPSGLGSAF